MEPGGGGGGGGGPPPATPHPHPPPPPPCSSSLPPPPLLVLLVLLVLLLLLLLVSSCPLLLVLVLLVHLQCPPGHLCPPLHRSGVRKALGCYGKEWQQDTPKGKLCRYYNVVPRRYLIEGLKSCKRIVFGMVNVVSIVIVIIVAAKVPIYSLALYVDARTR